MIDWIAKNALLVASLTLAISALFVSACALGVSLWQGWTTRDHNKKSVLPILDFQRLLSHLSDQGLKLVNVGLGPALIKNIIIYVDNELISEIGPGCGVEMVQALDLDPRIVSRDTLERPFSVRAGESYWLIQARHEKLAGDLVLRMREYFQRLRIVVEFESMYGEKDECELSPLAPLQMSLEPSESLKN